MTELTTREHHLANYEDTHDATGLFIPMVGAPHIDGSQPIDEATGLRVSVPLTSEEPWRWPIGDSRYQPHPSSIVAARNGGATDTDIVNLRISTQTREEKETMCAQQKAARLARDNQHTTN